MSLLCQLALCRLILLFGKSKVKKNISLSGSFSKMFICNAMYQNIKIITFVSLTLIYLIHGSFKNIIFCKFSFFFIADYKITGELINVFFIYHNLNFSFLTVYSFFTRTRHGRPTMSCSS